MYRSLMNFLSRVTGRSEPLEAPTILEMVLTLVWLSALALGVILFWPDSGGTFIYEGF
ncbi:MAG: hypothetical protein HUU29_12255 [Planctomycetaceae bacterium]|nr:hypothetical protein [Planctomycetaceae bacterium]